MISIRCNESEKDKVNVLLDEFKDNNKKRNIDIIIDALEVYEKYQEKVKAKIEKATSEIWGE